MNYSADVVVLLGCWLCAVLTIVAGTYTDKWGVKVVGGEESARRLVEKHGFEMLDHIVGDYYHVRHHHVSKRSVDPSPQHHLTLAAEPQVHWLEQQRAKRRVKRDLDFNDPKWTRMWYLHREKPGRVLDMHVKPAWERGVTGKGIVVSILDDGIEKDHPDLKRNYDPEASYDVNGRDYDPMPRYDYTNENRHGTRCAGEVAAEANNNICSVGVAYKAKIGGVRMLDGDVTDAVEAQSLSLNPQHIDIYSASWGPDDDGQTVDGPGTMARAAFEDGINKGRSGRGSIFVWASGNGGREGDSCNCDGYTNSIYTLSISSATESGQVPWYSEKCSSTLATTYSSGSGGERQIVTTDLRKGCTETHTGTSASAPLAAGICALALQALPAMTWRDMQHIVVMTARPENLVADDWVVNGVGRKVSHHFGFGLMDAAAMVDHALNWTTVPPQHRCEQRSSTVAKGIPVNGNLHVSMETTGCQGTLDQVMYLEHVEAHITLTASRRGEVEIFLHSPQGTKSTLLPRRNADISTEGFTGWAFMTTHNWGEMASGKWSLEVQNRASASHRSLPSDTAKHTDHHVRILGWTLVMYGTARHPYHSTTTHAPNTSPYPYPGKIRSRQRAPGSKPGSRRSDYPHGNQQRAYGNKGGHAEKGTSPTLKEWSLVMYGTDRHPVDDKRQGLPPPTVCPDDENLLDRTCVKDCPAGYFSSNVTAAPVDVPDTSPFPPVANDSSPVRTWSLICRPCPHNCIACNSIDDTDCVPATNASFTKLVLNILHKNKDVILIVVTVVIVVVALVVFVLVFCCFQVCTNKSTCCSCSWCKHRQGSGRKLEYKRIDLEHSPSISLGSQDLMQNGKTNNIDYARQQQSLLGGRDSESNFDSDDDVFSTEINYKEQGSKFSSRI